MFTVQLVTQKVERWPYMAVIKGISVVCLAHLIVNILKKKYIGNL